MIFKRYSWSLIFICLIGTANLSLAIDEDNLETDDSSYEAPEVAEEENRPKIFVADEEFVTIATNYGDVKGFREYSSKGMPFYSYLGIPFAKAPVGSLRFKDPEFPENWEGVRDGTVEPPVCTQFDLVHFATKHDPPAFGEEDCLYLNVYTPQPTMDRAELPVLVYIHGGLFTSGSAKDYKPYDLLNEDVVLVVLQYRLGVLGFLSTEDSVMPGNLGLKDQTQALIWIHRNIEFFGGSPLRVTLFGSDAGAVSVHFQSLTHRTIGLFNRGIMQSGTALCPWGMGGVLRDAAHHIGRLLNCTASPKEPTLDEEVALNGEDDLKNKTEAFSSETYVEESEVKSSEAKPNKKSDESKSEKETAEEVNESQNKSSEETEVEEEASENNEAVEYIYPSSEELMECLQNAEPAVLTKMALNFFMWNTMPLIFAPYADGTYIPETPEFLLREKRHKRLDLIIGMNKDEGAFITNTLFSSEGRRVALKNHFPIVGPISLEFTDDDIAPVNMSIKAYDHYMKSLKVDGAHAYNLTRLYTDRHYSVCSDLTALKHAENNVQRRKNVYFYELQHRGERSTGDHFKLSFGKEWVSHGDELFYLFPMTESGNATRSDDDSKLSEIMTKLWKNFAAYGNPTPDGNLGFKWEPFTHTEKRHLALTTDPSMEDDKREQIREFWTSLPTRQNIMFFKEKFIRATPDDKDSEEVQIKLRDVDTKSKNINEADELTVESETDDAIKDEL